MTTKLIVTVDTEEDGLWSGSYPRYNNTVDNMRGVERLQHECDRFGIRPTYLVDAPVVLDDYSQALLGEYQRSDRAEIGAHVHPWCNPPFEEEVTSSNSYLCNLSPLLQHKKIAWLTDAIENRFGRRPVSFRAGRYGLDSVGASILRDLGYLADSSVIPFSDYSSDGGPSFEGFPNDPYFVGNAGLQSPDATGELLEVPVTLGYNRMDFRRAHNTRKAAMRAPLQRLHVVGILDRLHLVKRIKFSPEQAGEAQLKCLFDIRLAQKAECVVLMFHSSSLVAEGSPYVQDASALDRFHERLIRLFEHVICQRKCESCTLSEFASLMRARRRAA